MIIEIRTKSSNGVTNVIDVKAKEVIIPTPKGYRFAVHRSQGINGYSVSELSTGYNIVKGIDEEDEAIANARLIILEKLDVLDESIAEVHALFDGKELNQINDFFN